MQETFPTLFHIGFRLTLFISILLQLQPQLLKQVFPDSAAIHNTIDFPVISYNIFTIFLPTKIVLLKANYF